MRRRAAAQRWWMAILIALVLSGAYAQMPPPIGEDKPALDAEFIAAKLKEIETSSHADDPDQQKLAEMYRNILAELRLIKEHAAAGERYTAAMPTAAAEAREVRRALEHSDGASPVPLPPVDASMPLEQIEQLLEAEKAKAVAAEAELKDTIKQKELEARRPGEIRARLAEIEEAGDLYGDEAAAAPGVDTKPELAQARKWMLESRRRAIETEVSRLRQELLSHPPRMELTDALHLKREQHAEFTRARVAFLERTLNQRRVAEAERAQAEAQAARQEATGKHPLVEDLAQRNATLSQQISSLAAKLDEINAAKEIAQKKAKQVEADFSSAKAKLEVGGMSQALGRVLMEQRRSLPDTRAYRKEAKLREAHVADINLLQIQHNEERRSLQRISKYLDDYTKWLSDEEAEAIEPALTELAGDRITLLDRALSTEDVYLRALGELDFVQQEMMSVVSAYDDFLDRWLLWIRTAPPASTKTLELVPHQLASLLSRDNWAAVWRIFWTELLESPVAVIVGVLALVLVTLRKRLRVAMLATSRYIYRPMADSVGHTLLGLGLVLLLALPLPLLMATVGLLLRQSVEASGFVNAVGVSLVAIAILHLELNSMRNLCAQRGVAARHFNWPERRLKPLRAGLRGLLLTFLPAGLIAGVVIISDRYAQGGGLGRFAFALAMLSLAYFFYRLLDPRQEHRAAEHPAL